MYFRRPFCQLIIGQVKEFAFFQIAEFDATFLLFHDELRELDHTRHGRIRPHRGWKRRIPKHGFHFLLKKRCKDFGGFSLSKQSPWQRPHSCLLHVSNETAVKCHEHWDAVLCKVRCWQCEIFQIPLYCFHVEVLQRKALDISKLWASLRCKPAFTSDPCN